MPLSIHWHIPALWDDMTRWNSCLSYLCFAISSTTIDLAGCLRAALADLTHFGWRAADGAPAQWLIYVCGSSGVRDKHGRKTQSSPQWPSRKTNKEGTINGSLCAIFLRITEFCRDAKTINIMLEGDSCQVSCCSCTDLNRWIDTVRYQLFASRSSSSHLDRAQWTPSYWPASAPLLFLHILFLGSIFKFTLVLPHLSIHLPSYIILPIFGGTPREPADWGPVAGLKSTTFTFSSTVWFKWPLHSTSRCICFPQLPNSWTIH